MKHKHNSITGQETKQNQFVQHDFIKQKQNLKNVQQMLGQVTLMLNSAVNDSVIFNKQNQSRITSPQGLSIFSDSQVKKEQIHLNFDPIQSQISNEVQVPGTASNQQQNQNKKIEIFNNRIIKSQQQQYVRKNVSSQNVKNKIKIKNINFKNPKEGILSQQNKINFKESYMKKQRMDKSITSWDNNDTNNNISIRKKYSENNTISNSQHHLSPKDQNLQIFQNIYVHNDLSKITKNDKDQIKSKILVDDELNQKLLLVNQSFTSSLESRQKNQLNYQYRTNNDVNSSPNISPRKIKTSMGYRQKNKKNDVFLSIQNLDQHINFQIQK